jgi:predicted DNA-binding transcriptional regulator AlpA
MSWSRRCHLKIARALGAGSFEGGIGMTERRFLNTAETAEYLGISKVTLEKARSRALPGFPPFVRIGGGVRYDLRDLETFIDQQKSTPAA